MPAANQPPDPLVGAILEDRWRLKKKIQDGGMGSVYEAEQLRLRGRRVAVKLIKAEHAQKPDYLHRFRREAELAASVSDPHVVTVLDFGLAKTGEPFLVMEFVEGSTLDGLMSQGPLSLARAVSFGVQLADALHCVHEVGLIHRDVKLANAMVYKGTDHLKLMDFGIARPLDDPSQTQAGVVLGTPYYMAPEQAQTGAISRQTDIYSWGVVLYALIAGRRPFEGSSATQVRFKHIHERPRALSEVRSGVPLELEQTVMRALEKKPEDRQRTMAEAARALRALRLPLDDLHSTGPASAPVPVPEPARISSVDRVEGELAETHRFCWLCGTECETYGWGEGVQTEYGGWGFWEDNTPIYWCGGCARRMPAPTGEETMEHRACGHVVWAIAPYCMSCGFAKGKQVPPAPAAVPKVTAHLVVERAGSAVDPRLSSVVDDRLSDLQARRAESGVAVPEEVGAEACANLGTVADTAPAAAVAKVARVTPRASDAAPQAPVEHDLQRTWAAIGLSIVATMAALAVAGFLMFRNGGLPSSLSQRGWGTPAPVGSPDEVGALVAKQAPAVSAQPSPPPPELDSAELEQVAASPQETTSDPVKASATPIASNPFSEAALGAALVRYSRPVVALPSNIRLVSSTTIPFPPAQPYSSLYAQFLVNGQVAALFGSQNVAFFDGSDGDKVRSVDIGNEVLDLTPDGRFVLARHWLPSISRYSYLLVNTQTLDKVEIVSSDASCDYGRAQLAADGVTFGVLRRCRGRDSSELILKDLLLNTTQVSPPIQFREWGDFTVFPDDALVVLEDYPRIQLWNTKADSVDTYELPVKGMGTEFTDVAYLHSPPLLVLGSYMSGGRLDVFDLLQRQMGRQQYPSKRKRSLDDWDSPSIAVSPDERFILVAGHHSAGSELIRTSDWQVVQRVPESHGAGDGASVSVDWSRDGSRVLLSETSYKKRRRIRTYRVEAAK
jgi:serine/threonine-protein kinase